MTFSYDYEGHSDSMRVYFYSPPFPSDGKRCTQATRSSSLQSTRRSGQYSLFGLEHRWDPDIHGPNDPQNLPKNNLPRLQWHQRELLSTLQQAEPSASRAGLSFWNTIVLGMCHHLLVPLQREKERAEDGFRVVEDAGFGLWAVLSDG